MRYAANSRRTWRAAVGRCGPRCGAWIRGPAVFLAILALLSPAARAAAVHATPVPGVSALPALEDPRISQVVVTSDALAPGFEPFAAEQSRRGVPTVVRTISAIESSYAGSDRPARVRAFLRDAHRLWGTRYVLLGGGPGHVPVRYVPWGSQILPSDLYYACLDGSWNEDGDDVFGEPNDLADFANIVNDVSVDPEGGIWLATYAGVVELREGRFTVFDVTRGLPSDHVLAVSVAPDGSVWAGTAAGLARLVDGVLETFGVPDALPTERVSTVLALARDDVWIGTDRGAGHFDGEAWRSWRTADGFPSDLVTGIARAGSSVWVGTRRGIARIANGRVEEIVDSELATEHVTCIGADPLGRIWVGHSADGGAPGGISRQGESGWITDDLVGWAPLTVHGFAFGDAGEGAWIATGEGLLRAQVQPETFFEPVDDLPVGSVSAVAVTPEHDLALASPAGYVSGAPGRWSLFTCDNGLPQPPREGDDIDLRPELVVGRLPVRDRAELAVYLEKLRAYEAGEGTDRVETVLVHAEILSPSLDGRTLAEEALARVPTRFARTELYESEGNLDAGRLATALSSGWGLAIHVCHGSYDVLGAGAGLELLFNSDLRAVDSGRRFGLHVVEGCRVGGFDHDCSMEHLLLNPEGGAIAVIANTRDALARTDSSFDVPFLERFFASDHGRPAEAWCEAITEQLAADPERFRRADSGRRVLLTRTYLGPPTLSLWRSVPHDLAVVHPPVLPVGTGPLAVTVRDAASGEPVAGARVCASKGAETYAHGRTDEHGAVTLEVRPTTPGSLEVAVTAPDFVPYDGSTSVTAPAGPRLLVDGWSWSSPGQGSRGIRFEIRNTGLPSATGWSLRLTSLERGVTVVQGVGALEGLEAGERAMTTEFVLASDLRNGARFPVTLRSVGEDALAETIRIEIESPDLRLDGFERSGDHLQVRLSNQGDAPTGPLDISLEPTTAGTLVPDGLATSPSISPGDALLVEDPLRVVGHPADPLLLQIRTRGSLVLSRLVDLDPPPAPRSARFDPREDGVILSWERVRSPDLAGYRVLVRNGAGAWDEALPGTTASAARAEIAFAPGTSREFAVVSVDHSGNESSDSCFVVAHSNDPSLAGWPRPLSAAAGPSPVVVADLDGNGRSEVLFGSMWEANALHVFRSDGTEWSDGDADPSTFGIFARTEERVTAAPLVADVDGDRLPEIFVASCDGYVYGWRGSPDATGRPDPLPGWPIFHDERGVRSPPVAGDLDGDGQLEIVTIADDGWMRAFEIDASMLAGWPREVGRPVPGSAPAISDLDGNGGDDVVFGVPDGPLFVLSGDGHDLAGWPFSGNGGFVSSPVLADLDGDADLEILVLDGAGFLWALHHDDRDSDQSPDVVVGWPVLCGAAGGAGSSPAVADFEGDGVPEIVLNGSDAVWLLNADGTAPPGWPVLTSAAGVNSAVVADLDGDGSLDVLVGSEDRRVTAYGSDGLTLPAWPLELLEVPSSTPYVADLDGDGDLDVLLAANDAIVRAVDVRGRVAVGATPWPGFHGGRRLDGVYRPPARARAGTAELRPSALALLPPRPNPFRGSVVLGFALPRSSPVRLDVYDVRGRHIARPVERAEMPAGAHVVGWDGRTDGGGAVASGVYFLRLEAGGKVRVRRILRVR